MNRITWQAMLVATAMIHCAPLRADDLKVATVFIRLSEDVDVPAGAPGILDAITVKEGQAVSRGELLGQIESAEQKLEVDRKRFDLLMARKQAENRSSLEFAQKQVAVFEEQLARAQSSRETLKNSISLKEIEDMKLSFERAAHEVKRGKQELEVAEVMCQLKESELALAEQQVERRKILSPANGIVSTIDRDTGEWVQPGERVLRIVRLDLLRAEGFIDAREAIDNIAGAAVTVTVDVPSKKPLTYEGKLVFIDPEVEPATGQVRVRAEFSNDGLRLRPGMRASMVIHKENAVPASARETTTPAAAAP